MKNNAQYIGQGPNTGINCKIPVITPKKMHKMMMVDKIYIPLTKPYIILSILQSIGLGLKAMVMAELISQAKNSIGREMYEYRSLLDMDYIFAWGLLMIAIVIISEIFIRMMKKKIVI